MAGAPLCPCCGQADQSYKVSQIYVEATASLHRRGAPQTPLLDALLAQLLPQGSAAEKRSLTERLVRDLAPPAGRARAARRIHPDWMIVFLCAVGLGIAAQVSGSQPGLFPIIVTLLGGTLLVYLLARKPVLARFTQQSRMEEEDRGRIERDVGRWMQLYLCAREPCVYQAQTSRYVPIDQMRRLFEA